MNENLCNDINSLSDVSQDFFSVDEGVQEVYDINSISSSISAQVSFVDIDAEMAEQQMEDEFYGIQKNTPYDLHFQLIRLFNLHFCKVPILTSFVFLMPFVYYMGKHGFLSTPYLLFIQCIIMSLISSCFWIDPVENYNTHIHKIDAFCARITIAMFILYNIFFQITNVFFFISTFIMGIFFYLSHYFSTKDWCGTLHIVNHTSAHIFACISIYFTLFPYKHILPDISSTKI